MTNYRAFALGSQDGLTLHMVQRPVVTPGHGEIVMKVRATGIGARDIRIMTGDFGAKRPVERIPGQDNAGEVIAVGPGAEGLKVGDRVVCCHYPLFLDGDWDFDMARLDYGNILDGFFAEQALVPANAVVKIPDTLSFEEASTLQSSVLTPWRALIDARIKPGETMVTLGTGNVSVFALQLAKMMGARVIITSSSDDKLAKVKTMGADEVINYAKTPDWEKEVLRLTGGRGANVVMNTVGFASLEKSMLAAASRGRVMVVGAGASTNTMKSMPNLIMKDLTVRGFSVGSRAMLAELIRGIVANRIKPHIDRVFPFEQTVEAVRYAQSGEKIGKVVIRMA